MPLTLRKSAGRRRKQPDEKLSERPGEPTSSLVMAPTRMKLRVRRPDGVAAARGGQPAEREQRSQESSSRNNRRKNTSNSTAAAAAATSSPPSSSTSLRAVVAAEETSPDSKCPICLDRFNNLAYLDHCLHRFCFPCIQEWSHNKAECPLCKQPFTSILHSVRAEDDFKEYTLRPAPANSSVAATVAMVAAMASAARSDHQMRLMLRRHRTADGGEMTTRRWRRERGGREGGNRRTGVWEWYLDSLPLRIPPLPHHPAVSPMAAEDSGQGDEGQQGLRGGADIAERGVIFEGRTALRGGRTQGDRASRRLMTRLAVRQRLQREGGNVQRLRERDIVAFRRALYRCGVRVHGVAGISGNQAQLCDLTEDCFRRLRPWLRRELTVLYGAHSTMVDIVQHLILMQLTHHGFEDLPAIEDELRPFLRARTEHFLHEMVSFTRSPLSLDEYDLQAVYEPPTTTLELDGLSSPSDTSSVIAISEGEEETSQAAVMSESLQGRPEGTHDDVIQTGSCLSLSAWDDETPGPSYSTAEPSCSLTSLSFSPAPQEAASQGEGQRLEGEGEDECLIVGYKKPIAERTPELVQLSSDTEGDDKGKEEEAPEKLPVLPSTSPPLPLPQPPTAPPSTSAAALDQQDDKPEETAHLSVPPQTRARSWSDSSGKSQELVCRRRRDGWTDRKQSRTEMMRDKKRRKNRKRGRERSGTLSNPNRSIYPAMMRSCSRSPCHSSVESGSPPPSSPLDSSWEYLCSPLPSSDSSLSHSSSPLYLSPHLSSPPPPQTPPTPALSHCDAHHREKPGGKRKYKSRHLDSNDGDPTWRPSSSSHHRQKRKESERRRRRRRRRRARDGARRRERQRRESGGHSGESSSSSSSSSSRRRRCREDRSPSVEIIYEGLVTSDTAKPPARKRHKKRHCKTQHSSSPVIITLDSDNSHDDTNNLNINSSSSSLMSSQQTIDFSELPPLPLVHSAGASAAMDAEIGELPVDILDRGSEASETELLGQSEAAGSIAVGQMNDVSVENVESSSPVGRNEGGEVSSDTQVDKNPTSAFNPRGATSENSCPQQRSSGDNDAAPITTDLHRRNPEVLTSDSCLLATVLNDLKGIPPPKCDPSETPIPSCLPDTRRKHLNHLSDASRGHVNQDDWSTDPKLPNVNFPEERQYDDDGDQSQVLDLLKCWSSSLPLAPPLQGECREEQAGPVQPSNNKTPTPVQHNDAESPHLSPSSPLFSVDTHPLSVDLNPDQPASHVDAPPSGPVAAHM